MQDRPNRSASKGLGQLISYKKNECGIDIETSFGNVSIAFFDERIVQVWGYMGKREEDFSYAVVGTPMKIEFSISDLPEKIQLTTSALKVTISKSPVRVQIFTLGYITKKLTAFSSTIVIEVYSTSVRPMIGLRAFLPIAER